MRKLFYAVALLFAMSALFVSCNKDNGGSEGDYSKLIVGTWKVEGLTEVEQYYTFYADGTYTGYGHIEGFDDDDINVYPRIRYTLKGNQLTNALGSITIIKLTQTEMIWEYTDGKNNVHSTRLIRVK